MLGNTSLSKQEDTRDDLLETPQPKQRPRFELEMDDMGYEYYARAPRGAVSRGCAQPCDKSFIGTGEKKTPLRQLVLRYTLLGCDLTVAWSIGIKSVMAQSFQTEHPNTGAFH